MAKAKTPKPSAVQVDNATTPDLAVEGLRDSVRILDTDNAKLREEVQRLSGYINLNRHEQVAAYRNGRDAALDSLKELASFVAGIGSADTAVHPMLTRARHAITRAEAMP